MKYEMFIGRSECREDTVSPQLVRALAATLDQPTPYKFLPPLWHWVLFQEWAPASALGADGHPQRGSFLPQQPELPRRMWVGGRIRFHRPLHVGEFVTRTSTILNVEEKQGASGRLLFITVQHSIANGQGEALTEGQDLVYRSPPGAAGAGTELPARPVPDCKSASMVIDTPLLFRYSAVTGNAHRIHYDQDYAVSKEGYESLVVHGPLQATLLAGFAVQHRAGQQRLVRELAEFSFRNHRPALLRRCPLLLEAWSEAECLRLRSLDRERMVCTTAEARFHQ